MDEIKKVKDEHKPEATYTKFGEKIRHVIPAQVQCSVACGGKNCKWENPNRWSANQQAINGVYSSWVLPSVLAMARPSTMSIEKYNIIQQFKRNNICSIINLQRPGEHASCGPGLEKDSLFTYLPQHFMDNNIFFYNFIIKDYGTAKMGKLLDMVKVMSFAISEGKVAVHCHAGLGRTGVLISCYLVYSRCMSPASAINLVRSKRPNSIQTRGQINCIHQFYSFLSPFRTIFPQVVPNSRRFTLQQFLARQRLLSHGYESRKLKFVPKIISFVIKRLTELIEGIQFANSNYDQTYDKQEIWTNIPLKRCNTLDLLSTSNVSLEADETKMEVVQITSPPDNTPDSESIPCDVEIKHDSTSAEGENAADANNEVIGDDELRLIEDEILENKNWRNANNHNNSGKKQLSDAAEGELASERNLQTSSDEIISDNGSLVLPNNTNTTAPTSIQNNNSCDHLVIDVNVDDAKIEDDAVLNQKNHQSSTDEIFHSDGKFESDCKENEATNLIKCDQPVIMLVEDDELMEFEQVIELDSVKNQDNTNMVLKESQSGNISGDLNEHTHLKASNGSCQGRVTPLMYRGERITKAQNLDINENDFEVESHDVYIASPPQVHCDVITQEEEDNVEEIEVEENMREESSDDVNKTLPPAEIKKVPDDSSKWGSSLNCTFPGENYVVPSSGNFLAVARALAYKLEDDEYMWEKVYRFQRMLKDHSSENWSQLSKVTDSRVLTSLMWSWVEHLREPVLSDVNLQQLCGVDFSRHEEFEDALKNLGKPEHGTLMCIMSVLTSFPPLPRKLATKMVDRTVEAVTTVKNQQVCTDEQVVEKGANKKKLAILINKYVNLKYEHLNKIRYIEEKLLLCAVK